MRTFLTISLLTCSSSRETVNSKINDHRTYTSDDHPTVPEIKHFPQDILMVMFLSQTLLADRFTCTWVCLRVCESVCVCEWECVCMGYFVCTCFCVHESECVHACIIHYLESQVLTYPSESKMAVTAADLKYTYPTFMSPITQLSTNSSESNRAWEVHVQEAHRSQIPWTFTNSDPMSTVLPPDNAFMDQSCWGKPHALWC